MKKFQSILVAATVSVLGVSFAQVSNAETSSQPGVQSNQQVGLLHRWGIRDIELPGKRIEALIPVRAASSLHVAREGMDSFQINVSSREVDRDAIEIVAYELRRVHTTKGKLSLVTRHKELWDQQYKGRRTLLTFHKPGQKIIISIYPTGQRDVRGQEKVLAHLAEYRQNKLVYAGLISGISGIVADLNAAINAAHQHNDANAEYIIGSIKDKQSHRRHNDPTLIMSH